MIAHNVVTEISAHNIIPCNNGRTPVFFSTCMDSPDPIRKSVSVRPACEACTMAWSRAGTGSQVFSRMATMNRPINQGILIFARVAAAALAPGKKNATSNDTGMIHSARASLPS
jgi:hypothetical protein